MSYISDNIEFRKQESFMQGIAKWRGDHGRGMDNIPTCPTCSRATVLIEHEYTPQLRLITSDDQPEREGVYFTCEWCNSPIDASEVGPRAPRKPATSAGWESDEEWARRVA